MDLLIRMNDKTLPQSSQDKQIAALHILSLCIKKAKKIRPPLDQRRAKREQGSQRKRASWTPCGIL
jgi:hypothetical protein